MITALFLAALMQVSPAAQDEPSASHEQKDPAPTAYDSIPVIEVRSQRHTVTAAVDSSISVLSSGEIDLVAPRHPNEILNRVPGAWVSAGSGQEHLTAIRSPVLTGAGACAAFMVLEDDVPTRPSGFCNVNQLLEVNLAQAAWIDVLRGPGTVTYGSNALNGAIAVLTPGPASEPYSEFFLEAGSDSYYRGGLALSGAHAALQGNFTDSGSFRDDESFRHGLLNAQVTHTAGKVSMRTSFAFAQLDQDTAGYIPGRNAYRDENLRTQNLNPEAYRKARAIRLSSRWNWLTGSGNEVELIPYARSSRMEFLQHFLPGKPLEENGQNSAGMLLSWSNEHDLSAGLDLEWAEGDLTEFQESPLESGSNFLRETRPAGLHYDYSVKAITFAGWLQWQHELQTGLQLTAGIRAEHLIYDYNNLMPDGNTRDDGTECGFGGCLYTRPADRRDHFTNLSPELGLSFNLTDQQMLYLRAARGYRAPQATELYRLQSGQTVADLESETLDSVEVGLKGLTDRLAYELTAYLMRKRHFIFRDANGFNISDGKTRHLGLESQLNWQVTDALAFNANLSWARHEYDFNRDLGGSEVILRGNEIDTAPAWLGGLQLEWRGVPGRALEAEWVYQGGYYLDAANAHRYPGHSLLNLRGSIVFGNHRHQASLRLTNLLDIRYAERADFAFGAYRYFPGAGRRISLEWKYMR
ncbi:MAG TPA: TonB-dependent receptor [Xanthomonadales bacterium]